MSESNEIWKEIPEFEGYYEASSFGRIRRHGSPAAKPLQVGSRGYLTVTLSKRGGWRPYLVHRLVLMAHVGLPPEGHEACHNNGIQTDNRIANLRWGTHSANSADQVIHGTHRNVRKTHCKRGHEFTPENTYAQPSKPNARRCVACQNAANEQQAIERRAAGRTKGPKRVLGESDARRLRQLRDEGWTFAWLADEFNISIACAYTTNKRGR